MSNKIERRYVTALLRMADDDPTMTGTLVATARCFMTAPMKHSRKIWAALENV